MNAKDYRSPACIERAAEHGFDPYCDAFTLEPTESDDDKMWRQRLEEKLAELRRANWLTPWPCLFDLDGVRQEAKLIQAKHGTCWAYFDEHDVFTGDFVSDLPDRPIDPETFWEPTLLQAEPSQSASHQVLVGRHEADLLAWEHKRDVWEQKHGVRRVILMVPTYARVREDDLGKYMYLYRTDGY